MSRPHSWAYSQGIVGWFEGRICVIRKAPDKPYVLCSVKPFVFLLLTTFIYLEGGIHVPRWVGVLVGGQLVVLSTMRTLGITLRLSALAASALACWALSQTSHLSFSLHPSWL